MKGTVLYSTKTGVEVSAVSALKRRGGYEEKQGRIRVRAFSMENGKEQIRVILNSAEAHRLARAIKSVIKTTPKESVPVIIHKSQTKEGESTSKIILDYFKTKKGTEGVGIILVRDKSKINIPLSKDDALYLADLLTYLSMEQSWFQVKKIEQEEEVIEEETPQPQNEGLVTDDEEEIVF